MNDNKRLYYKLTTYFWWFISVFPIIFFVVYSLGYVFNKSVNNYDFINIIDNIYSYFDDAILTSGIMFNKLFDAFSNLFNYLGLTSSNNYFSDFISFTLSWFILVHFLHLVVDFILILPRICQKFIERV